VQVCQQQSRGRRSERKANRRFTPPLARNLGNQRVQPDDRQDHDRKTERPESARMQW